MKGLLAIEKTARTLIEPYVSEKSTRVLQTNQHVFRVDINATKQAVKKAVEAHYEVEVAEVNLLNVKGKLKGTRGSLGYRRSWKKAYVTLAEGHTIITSGMEG